MCSPLVATEIPRYENIITGHLTKPKPNQKNNKKQQQTNSNDNNNENEGMVWVKLVSWLNKNVTENSD